MSTSLTTYSFHDDNNFFWDGIQYVDPLHLLLSSLLLTALQLEKIFQKIMLIFTLTELSLGILLY